MQERQKRILGEIISNSPGYTVRELADLTGSSEKTIRNDIQLLNRALSPYQVQIQKLEQRYIIPLRKKKQAIAAYTEVTRKDYQEQLLTSPQDRKIALLFHLLDEQSYCSMEELAALMYVSKATIFSQIHEIKHFLQATSRLQLEIQSHYGIRLLGDEDAKRDFLVNLFHLRISRSLTNKYMHAYLSKDIYQKIPEIYACFQSCSTQYHPTFSFDESYRLLSAILITLHRHPSFPLPSTSLQPSSFLIRFQAALERETGFQLFPQDLVYLNRFDHFDHTLQEPIRFYDWKQAVIQIHHACHITETISFVPPLSNPAPAYVSLQEEEMHRFLRLHLCEMDQAKHFLLKTQSFRSLSERLPYAFALTEYFQRFSYLKKRILIYESNQQSAHFLQVQLTSLFGERIECYQCTTTLKEACSLIQTYHCQLLITTRSIVSDFCGIPVIKVSRILDPSQETTLFHQLFHSLEGYHYQEKDIRIKKQTNDVLLISMEEGEVFLPFNEILRYKTIGFYAQAWEKQNPVFTSIPFQEQTYYLFFYPKVWSFAQIYQAYRSIGNLLFPG